MHILIACVGRMKACPERDLVNDYINRAGKTGRSLGVRSVTEVEVDAGGGMAEEARRLLDKCGSARIIRLEEHGREMKSMELSNRLSAWRDAGQDAAFLIGGADGLDPALKDRAPEAMSFGIQTWPHRLVRVMIAEQVYRAMTIQANLPYHRE